MSGFWEQEIIDLGIGGIPYYRAAKLNTQDIVTNEGMVFGPLSSIYGVAFSPSTPCSFSVLDWGSAGVVAAIFKSPT